MLDNAFTRNSEHFPYPIKDFLNFIELSKKMEKEHTMQEYLNKRCSDEQQKVLPLYDRQIRALNTCDPEFPKLYFILGKAGTRKSTVVKRMVGIIYGRLNPESLVVLVPTGVAAINTDDRRLHST